MRSGKRRVFQQPAKYGIHTIVLDLALENLRAHPSAHARHAADDIAANKPMANLGAIGPDLFFWAPDYKVVEKLFRLYRNYERIRKVYDTVVGPVKRVGEAVGDAGEAVVGSLLPHSVDVIKLAVGEVRETASLMQTMIRTELFAGVISVSDWLTEILDVPHATTELFQAFGSPVQEQLDNPAGLDVASWYWFDILHYRRTGTFAKYLVERAAAGTARQRAYAYGYLSHIGTDLTGHGFVNQVVGGPYRLNIQRHVAVENFLDAWAYSHYYDGASVGKTMRRRLALPEEGNLSSEIVSLLDHAFHATYPDSHPTRLGGDGFLSPDQIRETYDAFAVVLRMLESAHVDRPEEPFSGVTDILSQALADLLEAPPSPPEIPSNISTCSATDIFSFGLSDSSRDCYSNFFKEAKTWVCYLGSLVLWAIESALDLLDLILATLLALPVSVLLAILYGVQLLLYSLIESARLMLVDLGFYTPEPGDLNRSIGVALSTTMFACSVPFKYPFGRDLTRSHLICPSKFQERPPTAADFFASSRDVTVKDFVDGVPFSRDALGLYAAAESPAATRAIYRNGLRIGNSRDLVSWMIATGADPATPASDRRTLYTNWNLDGDRGYAYRSWNGHYVDMPEPTVAEEYVD